MEDNNNFDGWTILGAGAIGCLWATKLYREQIKVNLLLKSDDDLARYKTIGGITLTELQETLLPIPAVSIASTQAVISHLLICTKAHQTIAAFNSIATLINENTVIVVLQNGMGIAEKLALLTPNNLLFVASTTGGANMSKKFTVKAAGDGKTVLGAYSESAQAFSKKIVALLPRQPSPTVVSDDIHSQLWLKLAINCIINPLTSVNNCNNGELLKHAGLIEKMRLVAKEISLVAQACGQNIGERTLFNSACAVAEETTANISSMLQDVRAKKQTEIHFINGYVAQQAKLHNIKTPENDALIQQVLTLYKQDKS
jgi:2-dehydropantoate 2-reductase